MTSRWDVWTYWSFQQRSTRSNPRDLNLNYYEIKIPWTKACSEQLAWSWQLRREFVASLMCIICIKDLPRQFDALLARLHSQFIIFATIVLDLPKSVLGSFRPLQGSSRCVLSSNSSSLAYWNFHLIVLKHYILPQRHKQLISDIQKTELFPLLIVQCEDFR